MDLRVRRVGGSWHQQRQELPKSELRQKQVAGDSARGCFQVAVSPILTSRGRQGPPRPGSGFSCGRAATAPCGSHGRPGPRCGGTRGEGREGRRSIRAWGQMQRSGVPQRGKSHPPTLTRTQQRGKGSLVRATHLHLKKNSQVFSSNAEISARGGCPVPGPHLGELSPGGEVCFLLHLDEHDVHLALRVGHKGVLTGVLAVVQDFSLTVKTEWGVRRQPASCLFRCRVLHTR